MPSTMVELRPNRRLLDHNFEGYKLNLESLPQWSSKLAVTTDRVYPGDMQYSFLHAKLFALHNHLVADHWDCRNLYYVDSKQQVRMATFNSLLYVFDITVVYDVPAYVERKSGHFNLCLSFPNNSLALVSDGTGCLHIVDTGNRSKRESWKTLFSDVVLGEGKYFVIIDSRTQESDEKLNIHCLLQSVEQNEQYFYTVLTWVTYSAEGDNWKQTSMRQLQGKGAVHYAALESSLSAVYIASDNKFKFTTDTQTEIIEPTQEQPRQILYTWLQTSDDITITLKLPNNYDKKMLQVTVATTAIKVSYAGNFFLDGELRHRVDSEITTWNIEDGRVDILLTKSESKLWDELLESGDDNGEQILDPSLVEEAHQRLAHLCSDVEVTNIDQSVPGFSTQELEECDAASEEDTILVRQDVFSHTVTHQIPLSVHQFLFSARLSGREAPALALRHDVDSCVWQPFAARDAAWPVQHEGTLMAFGYIQSSKQNRKFVTCPPDFSYSVVCEASRHIFIYKASGRSYSQLRQRSAGGARAVCVGQQHVVNVDEYGEILGIFATNSHLHLLTETSLVAIGVL